MEEKIHHLEQGVLSGDREAVRTACRQLLENIQYLLDGKPLDYLVINHMEPDHGASIEEILIRLQAQEYAAFSAGRWHLTPKGFMLSNSILVELLEAQQKSRPLTQKK